MVWLSRKHILSFLVLLAILSNACNLRTNLPPEPVVSTPQNTINNEIYSVGATFIDFYNFLGGEQMLGPAISPVKESGNVKSQYVVAGLMVYDPQTVSSEQYHLAPLGLVLGVAEKPVPNPDPGEPDVRYINGHIIFSEFLPLYEQLGGAQFVGRPLTEGRYNPDKQRYEQYFENLGFYRMENDPPGDVKLISYGAFECHQDCRYQADQNGVPVTQPPLPEPFATAVSRMGLTFVGRSLTDPHLGPDGRQELIFENVVMVVGKPKEKKNETISVLSPFFIPLVLSTRIGEASKYEPGLSFHVWIPMVLRSTQNRTTLNFNVRLWMPIFMRYPAEKEASIELFPFIEMLGILPQPLQEPTDNPLMVFYPIQDGKGYSVPKYFDDYMQRHGGISVSGQPIGQVFSVGNGIFRQCYQNLCLDFNTQLSGDDRLKPAPLGNLYKEKFYKGGSFNNSQDLTNVQIKVWEKYQYVMINQAQEIFAIVADNVGPLTNREPIIKLVLPDGTQKEYTFPPTDQEGQTSIVIPPIQAPSGTLIPYQVCLADISNNRTCVGDNWLIWNR
jgi:hypothetical protein